MAYLAKVGSFNIDTTKTAGQTQSVAGVGFEPKIVFFWWSGSTGTSDTVAGGDIRPGFGAASSSTSRGCFSVYSLDAGASSDTGCATSATSCIKVMTNSTTLDGIMDFSAMTADGFDLIVDDQFASAWRISYLALGGTDLTNVYIGNQTMPGSTGNYNVTGVGFQPDAVLAFTTGNTALDNIQAVLKYSFGMATGSSNQGVIHGYSQDNQTTSVTRGAGYNGEFILIGDGYADKRESFVSFGVDGFTLNNVEGTSAYYYIYICLKGGQYKVHELTTRTDGNDIAESDVGFQPVAVLFASANRALSTVNTVSNNHRISIGAATSSSERACSALSDETGLADTETAYSNSDSLVYQNIVDDAQVGGMDVKSIDSGGFTCVMDDPDPSACWVTYLAIGANEEEGCVNVVMSNITTTTVIDVNIEVDVMCNEGGEPI